MNSKVSIIIPCYLLPDKNSELVQFTEQCVDSIRHYSPRHELVIVDNGSPIGGAFLRSIADVYVRLNENRGFAPAVNLGLAVSSNPWYVVCNNDITFLNDWIGHALENWKSNTGIFCSHLHDHDPEHAAGTVDVPVGHLFGALWMTNKTVIDNVGGLDEGYERGMFEDRDFAQRVVQAGMQVRKGNWVLHVGNATWGKLPDQHKIYVQNKKLYESRWHRWG